MQPDIAQGLLAKAPQPGHIDINFTTINWWNFVLILAVVYALMGWRVNRTYYRALGVLIGTAVVYAIWLTVIQPRI